MCCPINPQDGKEAREESSRLAAEVARLEKAAQQQADAAKAATNALLEDMKQQVAAEVAACERQEVEHLSLEVEQLQKMNAAAKDAQHAAASMADGLKQQLAEALAKAEVALREKQGLEAEVAKHKLVQRATQDALEARDKVMGIQQQINEQQGHVIQVGKTRQAQLTAENATLKEEREAQVNRPATQYFPKPPPASTTTTRTPAELRPQLRPMHIEYTCN